MATQIETGDVGTPQRCPVRHDYLPFSPEGINDPMGMIAPMREQTPVFFCEQTQMWVISRYDDMLAAMKDTKRLSSDAFRPIPLPDAARDILPHGIPIVRPSLINADPPAHTRVRKIANRSFTRPRVEAMRPAVQATADALIDAFAARGSCELISEFSAPLPAATFGAMLGLTKDDVPRILKWGDATMATMGTLRVPEEEMLACCERVAEFSQFIRALIADRRANPREGDFMTDMVSAADDDDPALTDDEILSMMSQFIVAGHETTRHLIGWTIFQLLSHPDQLQALRDDPSLTENAIEETLRHSGPAKGMFRVATQDVEIGGATIPAGDRVQIMFMSANHDAAAWDRPDEYDIRRDDLKRHIAFGKGAHFCIGAPLARLQAGVVIPLLLERLPGLRFAGGEPPSERIPSLTVSGLRRLELEWDAA